MNELLILRGLPASGKTTYAKTLVSLDESSWVRISRDGYRDMFWNNRYSPEKEKLVVASMKADIERFLKAGWSVVLDNTHLDPKHIKIAVEAGAGYNIFTRAFNTSVAECQKRNTARERDDTVTDQVISELAERWNWPNDRAITKQVGWAKHKNKVTITPLVGRRS